MQSDYIAYIITLHSLALIHGISLGEVPWIRALTPYISLPSWVAIYGCPAGEAVLPCLDGHTNRMAS